MFERFTERARQTVVLAQEESRKLCSTHIGSGHVLLGLMREQDGLGAQVLNLLNVQEEEIHRVLGQGNASVTGPVPFTKEAQKRLELALREALSLGHNYIGTEHILLGLTRGDLEIAGPGGVFTLDGDLVRGEVIRQLSGPSRRPAPEPGLSTLLRDLASKVHEVADALDETEASEKDVA